MSAWKSEALVLSALPGYLGKRNAFPGRGGYQGTKSPSLPWTEGSASARTLGKGKNTARRQAGKQETPILRW